MLLQSSRRGMRNSYKTNFWILDYYEEQRGSIPNAKGLRRMLRKQSRDRLRLIFRARNRGFDVHETVYLLKLYDDAKRTATSRHTQQAA